jgi:hypothetical protein
LATVDRLAGRFGVSVVRPGGDRSNRAHPAHDTGRTDGHVRKSYSGNDWTPGTSSPTFAPPSSRRDVRRSPPLDAFTPAERRLVRRLGTPAAVQAFLNALPYNTEPPPDPATLRTFRGVVAHHTAHCLEAALTAAVVLEQHGYRPIVMSLESIDASIM